MKDFLIAVLAWGLGVLSSEGFGMVRRRFAAVSNCLDKLDECANATERAVRYLAEGVADPTERIVAQTSRSDLGQLVNRAFGRHPQVANCLMLFSVELGACDPESSRAAKTTQQAEVAVITMRDAQQGLRAAINGTRQGRFAGFFGREN